MEARYDIIGRWFQYRDNNKHHNCAASSLPSSNIQNNEGKLLQSTRPLLSSFQLVENDSTTSTRSIANALLDSVGSILSLNAEIVTGSSIIGDEVQQHRQLSHNGSSNNNNNNNENHNIDHNDDSLHPLWHCMVAGFIGGAVGDSSMHSLDTVKTRQQAAPNITKYRNTVSAYRTIFLEEGLRRGLYGGYGAAMLGSVPSGIIFFGVYELVKRKFINDYHLNETFTHLFAGFVGDFATSFIYVPSEVLKTRLQLQGRFNNPFYNSGYNYRGLTDAMVTILGKEGWRTFFFGYKATLFRDLPFSALQFAFYEKFRQLAFKVESSLKIGNVNENVNVGKANANFELSLPSEILTGAAAGGIAGILTTPLDVFKTRLQTQNPSSSMTVNSPAIDFKSTFPNTASGIIAGASSSSSSSSPNTTLDSTGTTKSAFQKNQRKNYTIIPTTARPAILNTSSVIKGLYIVYKTEGVRGLFSGVQPRFIWTSIQSSIMLLLYQQTLKELSKWEQQGSLEGKASKFN